MGITATKPQRFNVAVTFQHNDAGWKHRVDRVELVGLPGNQLLATHYITRPRQNAAVFSLKFNNVFIPSHIKQVRARVHDTIDGFSPAIKPLLVPHKTSPNG